jgi:hypothetical protein
MFKSSSLDGIGGHLVRGRLAYLDRSSVPLDIRLALGLDDFGDPPAIYKEFLQRAGVAKVALDPRRADTVLRQMLIQANVDVLSRVEIDSVIKEGQAIAGIKLTRGEIYLAKQFIDSTVNAELAQAAGVVKRSGFETLGLPNSELSVTLVFETEGLSVQTLKDLEYQYLRRFTNPADILAQRYINVAAGFDIKLAQELRKDLVDQQGRLRQMVIGTDYIDIPSKALSIAYHSYRGTKLSLPESGAILDNGNIAILSNGRLSWNALLHSVNASEAETLARNGAKPTAAMLAEISYLNQWFKGVGATAVKPALELYIRHAGNVTGAVRPLTGAQMLAGGVPAGEALGTFGYAFDVRGEIDGLKDRAGIAGFDTIKFPAPLMNVGIQHALIKSVPNLAVVSPASGFEGYACSAGRIVEFNVAVGQGVGIAASIALLSGRQLAEITNIEVRTVLEQTGQLPRIYGRANMVEAAKLAMFEQKLAIA